ncbi:hypothetical protein COOONC_11543 [Cooperia oncophora]
MEKINFALKFELLRHSDPARLVVRPDSSTVIADTRISFFCRADDPARLVVRPDSSTVIADTRISFFCRADGNPLPNVIWKINGKSLIDSR